MGRVIPLHGTEPIGLGVSMFRKIAAVIQIAADGGGRIKWEFRVPKERLFGWRRTVTAGLRAALAGGPTRTRAEQIQVRNVRGWRCMRVVQVVRAPRTLLRRPGEGQRGRFELGRLESRYDWRSGWMRRIYAPRSAFCGRSRASNVRRILVMGILEFCWRAHCGAEARSARRRLFETGDVEGASGFLVGWVSVSLFETR